MARLSIGVDVAGVTQVEKLSNAISSLALVTDNYQKVSLKSSGGSQQMVKAAQDLDHAYSALGTQAAKTYAILQSVMKGPKFDGQSKVMAQVKAYSQLVAVSESYSAALAKQIVLEDKAAQAVVKKTATIVAQNKAVEALALKGIASSAAEAPAKLRAVTGQSSLAQGNYAAEILLENKSIEAQARGLAELQAQMGKLNATRAGLKQGNYAAEILLENKAIEAQSRGLAELQAQMGKLNATRAGLKQGNYASQMRTESIRSGLGQGTNAAQIAGEATLYDDSGRLKYAINNMKDYEAAMKRAASEATDFAATTGKGNSALGTLGMSFDKATGKGRMFHDMLRGASGAAGSLWMTYGQMAPLLAGFAAVGGTMATVSKGADLDYTARSIELLAYTFDVLSKNSELASASLEGTKQAILGIADTPFTAGELGKGILELSRAGYTDLAANLKNIDQASKFAYIGQMDLAQAVELVVGQMSAFKEIGKDAAPALNTMAVVADKTSISLQQMSEAFKNTTSLGTVMGLRFDDIAVALGVMGQAGIRGATAGAALNTMMYKLVAPTEMAQKKMRALGIEFDAFDAKTGQMKSIKTIAFELANMTKGLDTKQISGVFESMVGLRGVKALGALVQMARSSSDEFDKLSNAVKNSGGYLDGYMKILDKSGKVQIDKLKADFDRLFTANYDNATVVDALQRLRDVLKDPAIGNGMATISQILIKLVGAGAEAVGVFGKLATSFSNFPGIKLVTSAQGAIFDGLLNKIEQVGNGLDWLNKKFDNAGKYLPDFAVQALGLKKTGDAAKEAAEKAAKAKQVLADLAGVNIALPGDAKAGDLEKLQAVGDYFDSIQNKILDMNRTPLQIVDAQVTRDAANMLGQLSSGGLKLDDMIAVAKGYTQSIEDLGNEGSSSAKKIEAISESFAKTGAPKAKIKELQDLLKGLATSLNKKDIEKANKEMLAGMRKEWQSYADKVIELQDKIAGTQRTLAEELRAIDQSNMGGLSLWKDKQKEAKEYAATAKKAGQDALAAFATGDSVTGQKQFALAEEYFKKAAEAAKALNAEVKGSNQALDLQIDKAQSVLNVLKAQQEAYSARGQKSGPLDAQIANAEAALKVLEARKTATDSQILITKPQGAEEAKAIMQSLYDQQVKLQQAVQDSYKMQMESIQKKADTQMGSPVDMTQGMDDAKARWIQGILSVKEEAVKLAPEITAQLATVKMPTDAWQASFSSMKGMFVQAVDEMGAKVNSEFGAEKTVTRFSNAVPTQEYINAINALNGVKIDPVTTDAAEKVDGMKQNAQAFGTALQTAGDYVANSLVGNLLNVGSAISNNLDLLKGMNADGVAEFLEKTKTSLTSLGAGIADVKLGDSLREAFANTYEDMTKTNSAFIDSMGEGWKDTSSLAIDQIDSIYGSLKDLVDKDWTVKVQVEEARRLGGMLGGYHNGGMIQALASGGGVKNVLQGAYLPGFGGGDRRLLYGEDGEVMINKFAVAKATPQTALAFNRGDFGTVVDNLLTRFPHLLTGYAGGGMVSESPTTSSPTGPQAAGYSSSFTFTDTTGQQGRVFGTEPDIKLLERAINKHNRFRSSNK